MPRRDEITYAQFLRELQDLDPAMRKRVRCANRVAWLAGITDWAVQADMEARMGLPGDLPGDIAPPDAMEVVFREGDPDGHPVQL